MALREDVGLSWLVVVAVPVLALSICAGHPQDAAAVPGHADPDRRGQPGAARADHRHPGGPRLRPRAVRDRRGSPQANAELTATATSVGRLMASMFPIVMFVLNVSSVAVLWFGARRVDAGAMQIGSLTAFLTYLIQILMSVMMATFLLMIAPRAAVCAERIGEVLDTESSVAAAGRAGHHAAATVGRSSFADAEFTYPGADAPVLRDVTFTAEPGQTTAIIGSTGAGKTTLVSLIPRLFDATGGSVTVDGVEVRDCDPDLLWSRIGLVPQKPFLFSGTVASNLRYGNPTPPTTSCGTRCGSPRPRTSSAPCPASWRRRSPRAAPTSPAVSGNGSSIARALVKQPGDLRLRRLLLRPRRRHRRPAAGRAAARDPRPRVIIVGQRVATIADADQIVVLEDGEIVGVGTHERAAGRAARRTSRSSTPS